MPDFRIFAKLLKLFIGTTVNTWSYQERGLEKDQQGGSWIKSKGDMRVVKMKQNYKIRWRWMIFNGDP